MSEFSRALRAALRAKRPIRVLAARRVRPTATSRRTCSGRVTIGDEVEGARGYGAPAAWCSRVARRTLISCASCSGKHGFITYETAPAASAAGLR
jgi:hypothetical protein